MTNFFLTCCSSLQQEKTVGLTQLAPNDLKCPVEQISTLPTKSSSDLLVRGCGQEAVYSIGCTFFSCTKPKLGHIKTLKNYSINTALLKRCDPALPKNVQSFCDAAMKEDFEAVRSLFSYPVTINYTKFDGPECKSKTRIVLLRIWPKDFYTTMADLVSSIKRDLIEDTEDNPFFSKMGNGHYGTVHIGDCPHESSVGVDPKTGLINAIYIDTTS